MIEPKTVIDFAIKQGYESAYLILKWNGFDVYQPVYSEEMSYIGLPLMILVKDEKIRMTTPDEAFEIFDLINGVEENKTTNDMALDETTKSFSLMSKIKSYFKK